jgi:hypothetical protein
MSFRPALLARRLAAAGHRIWFPPAVVVAGPPVVVARPYPYYPYRHWVPAHYTYRGFYVPGHWG